MITDEQFTAWLKNQTAIRCILVEATVGQAGGGVVTRYLSNKAFVTGSADTPANTVYQPRITSGLQYTRAIDMDGNVSLTFGDLALTNIDGALDSWVDDYWVNRPYVVFLGDVSWARSDFRQVFSGVTLGLDMQNRDTLNIQLSDNTQRLNTPVSEVTLGGTTALANNLLPLLFGECHNVTPLSTDTSVNEYQIHNGVVERIIEVRDNGVPVDFIAFPNLGKFRLAAQPYGTVTCSAQGALIPAQFLLSTDAFTDTSAWNRSNIASLTQDAVAGPYAGTHATSVVCTSSGPGYVDTSLTTLTAGTIYTSSVFVKAGAASQVTLGTWADSFVGGFALTLNFSTGKATLVADPSALAHGGAVIHYGAVPVGNGWYRMWICGSNTSTDTFMRFRVTAPVGDGTLTGVYIAGAQVEAGQFPTSYWNGATPVGNAVYRNTVAELVRLLAMNYGDPRMQFAVTEIDIPAFVEFDAKNRQAIGFYLSDRGNVLDVCNQIASSIGARICMSAANKLTIVKLDLSQADPGTSITGADMVEKTLAVTAMPSPVAAVKLGYCRNWTVQNTLAGGLDQLSVGMFQQEWLLMNRSDSLASANFRLFTDPAEIDTMLINGVDAANEANRRLNLFNVQRKVLTYQGFYHLIFEELGAPQTMTHPRFGLSGGKIGQIISIAVDFNSPHITFEVLV